MITISIEGTKKNDGSQLKIFLKMIIEDILCNTFECIFFLVSIFTLFFMEIFTLVEICTQRKETRFELSKGKKEFCFQMEKETSINVFLFCNLFKFKLSPSLMMTEINLECGNIIFVYLILLRFFSW